MTLLKPSIQAGVRFASLFFAFLFLFFTPAQDALAAEMDAVRVGGDYEFKELPVGSDFNVCRRLCKKDVSCRAWTFIKQRVRGRDGVTFNLGPDLNIGIGGRKEVIPPQCRLKHSVGVSRANECCISGVKKIARRPRQDKAEKCSIYAEKSIQQQDRNLSSRCHYRGEKWHGNYRRHYRWCMEAPRGRSTRRLEARDDQLKECRSQRRVRNRQCERYASTAMDIYEQARSNDCLKDMDLSWDREFERVYDWCLDHRPVKRKEFMNKAQTKLAACLKRGGGPRVKRCETYADNALRQVEQANHNGCDVSGTIWRKSYKAQYQYCRKSSGREARRATERRDAGLKRCMRRNRPDSAVDNCREYGTVKLRQIRRAKAAGCGFEGPNWRGREKDLVRWCRRNGVRAANNVLERHRDRLKQCERRAEPGGVIRNCDQYAKAKSRQNRRADAKGCGFRGPNWRGTERSHARWCRSKGLRTARIKLEEHRAQLYQCEHRPEPVRIGNCGDYAKAKTRQNRRAEAKGCRFKGPNWRGSERSHVRWCRRNGISAARNKLNAHRQDLRDCERGSRRVVPKPPRGEVQIGCVTVSGRDTDTISVGRPMGSFRAIRLNYGKVSVQTYEARVYFANGQTEDIPVEAGWHKGVTSKPYRLNRQRRFIDRIKLTQKAKFKLGAKARVCVIGVR